MMRMVCFIQMDIQVTRFKIKEVQNKGVKPNVSTHDVTDIHAHTLCPNRNW